MYYRNLHDSEPPDTWYEPDYEPVHVCPHCTQESKDKEFVSGFMKEILNQLYGKNHLDSARLENALDEVAHFFELKLSQDDLQIERKKEKANPFYLSLATDLVRLQN